MYYPLFLHSPVPLLVFPPSLYSPLVLSFKIQPNILKLIGHLYQSLQLLIYSVLLNSPGLLLASCSSFGSDAAPEISLTPTQSLHL